MPWKIILQTCHASLGLMAVSATAAVQMIDHFLCPNAMMIGALANLESLLQADDSMTVSENPVRRSTRCSKFCLVPALFSQLCCAARSCSDQNVHAFQGPKPIAPSASDTKEFHVGRISITTP